MDQVRQRTKRTLPLKTDELIEGLNRFCTVQRPPGHLFPTGVAPVRVTGHLEFSSRKVAWVEAAAAYQQVDRR